MTLDDSDDHWSVPKRLLSQTSSFPNVFFPKQSGFWFNNVLLPCWIITSSLLSSYGQSVRSGDRLNVSVTVLLTLTTFKFLVAQKLPDVDYMTLLCAHTP
jgi:hypothetical protein